MKNIFVYIVLCNDFSYYTGVTNNIEKRIIEHNSGVDRKSYTFSRRPVKLVYLERFIDPEKAIRREKQIKGWSRKKKTALIEKNLNKLHEFSKCRNKTNYLNFEIQ